MHLPSSGKPIYWNARGPHGEYCVCNMPGGRQILEAIHRPRRTLQLIFRRSGDVEYRYLRHSSNLPGHHWLRIDWPPEETEISVLRGDVEIERRSTATTLHFRGSVAVDYTKRGFLEKLPSGNLLFTEQISVKGSSTATHLIHLHEPHCALSALRSRSTTHFTPKQHSVIRLRPSYLCPGFFFAAGTLMAEWELEIEEDVRREAVMTIEPWW